MYKTILVLTLIAFILACKSTKNLTQKENVNTTYMFPLEWIGEYEGDLHVYSNNSDTASIVKMKLFVDYPNSEGYYPWTLVYGENDVRQYGVEAVNPEKGHYIMDEYNSILLDCYLLANNFMSRFKVGDTNILVDYERVADGIHVQFYVSKAESHSQTGGEIIQNDTIPSAFSYKLGAYQKAFLKRKE